MRAHGLHAVAIAGCTALLLLVPGSSAHAGEGIAFFMNPSFPTSLDTVHFTMLITLPDGCFDVRTEEVQQTSTAITISSEAAEVPGPCGPPDQVEVQRTVGPLPLGTYDLTSELNVRLLCDAEPCRMKHHSSLTTLRVVPVGDADCDGMTDSSDAHIVLLRTAALLYARACSISADANRDGFVQSPDAALILQYSAGLLVELPPG